MSFQQGLSGLNAASKALDVIGNNVSNSSTVGFKSSTAHFADVFANSLAGAGAAQVGIGTASSAIQQSFTQGNITTTNNPLDLAINGGGFYRMNTNGTITYSRNGQFHQDKSGYIVDDVGRQLTGYPADATGKIVQSSPIALQMDASDQRPVATGAGSGTWKGARALVNLDSRSTVPTAAWANGPAGGTGTPAVPVTWSPDPSTYNWSTALSIYDSLGNSHTLSLYAVKQAGTGAWNLQANVDGTSNMNVTLAGGAAGAAAPLAFDSSGKLTTAMPIAISINLDNVVKDVGKTNNADPTLAFNIDFTGTSQYGSAFGANKLEQDGYTSGRLTGVNVSSAGIIRGSYSNGQSRDLGQVVLTNFANPNGLTSLGGNQWAETAASGSPLVGAPGSASLGVLQAAAIEESNIDLTAELVSMITQQRNYQSNAQTIKTQDAIMQTLVSLR